MPPLQRSPEVVGSFKRVSAQPRSLQLIFFPSSPLSWLVKKTGLRYRDWTECQRGEAAALKMEHF